MSSADAYTAAKQRVLALDTERKSIEAQIDELVPSLGASGMKDPLIDRE
jgi:hypothetical protein